MYGGYDIGILVMKSWVPKLPGHISCASNYNFPVYYLPVDETNTTNIHGGDKKIIPLLLEAIHFFEQIGCKAIVSSCGYFGHFQKEVAEISSIPVYLSAICMVPFISLLIRKEQKIGIICYNKEKLTDSLFDACGVSQQTKNQCVIYDVMKEKELGNIIKDQGHYNIIEARNEVVNIARKMYRENENMGAVLLECTDLPPHSFAIQDALQIPVFDATMMVNFVHSLF